MPLNFESIQRILSGEAPAAPVAKLIGFKLIAIEPGNAVFEFDVSEQHHNPMGTVHGGILCDVADAAMGFAYASLLEEGETFTTLDLNISFLRPFRSGKLIAVGNVVKRGRTVGLTECDVRDVEQRLIARASSTCMVLTGDAAAGR